MMRFSVMGPTRATCAEKRIEAWTWNGGKSMGAKDF
jgi:hypothetical protein